MEKPESIRASLILGEWVLSIDLSHAYLHIPIHPNSRKYPQVCEADGPDKWNQTSPVPDDWFIRAQSQEEAQLNTQAVVHLTQSLGWIINQEKSELKPAQVFSFLGYEYHLDSALVKPTQER